jgi:hypothetical protein
MSTDELLVVGVVVFGMLLIGAVLTILEFRKMK